MFYLGKSCRSKVTKDLNKLFGSPEVAEQHYMARPASGSTPQTLTSTSIGPSLPEMDTALPQPSTTLEGIEYCRVGIGGLSTDDKLGVLSALLTDVASFPPDYLFLAAKAADHLRESGRSNVIYSLAKALGTMRPDGSDSLLPAKTMPMGLIEYAANFFCATSVQKVSEFVPQIVCIN